MFSLSSIAVLSLVIVGVSSSSIGPKASLYIKDKYIFPDGFNRSAVLAGGTEASASFPGPLITAFKGDQFCLNVTNGLTDATAMLTSTSIHWHGLFQEGTNWSDGPAGITQCPIAPGNSFLYQFRVPDQAGTYWYHSHYSTQYCDGLRGALVVYDRNDPNRDQYDFDDDNTVITLSDWYHTPAPSAGLAPTFDATLINGKGRYAGSIAPLTVITVLPNKRYRFRMISMSCDPSFTFSIDGHSLTIIEVDGVNHQPLIVDLIQLLPGQRYSVILKTDQPIANYWIRALPDSGTQGFAGGVNSAILRYRGAPNGDPESRPTGTRAMAETDLHPLANAAAPGIPVPGAADININLDIQYNFTDRRYYVNDASFTPPSAPVLLQILSGAVASQDLLPVGSIYMLPPEKVVEISIPGGGHGSPHPMHLHGHTFSVVRSAGSSVYNYVNPVRRDVVNVGVAGDNTTIRFKTDNAGPWFLHCHIDWHLEIGLAVVMVEDIGTIATESPPTSWDSLCPTFDAFPPQIFNGTL